MNTELASPIEMSRGERTQRWLVMTMSVIGLGLSVVLLIQTWELESLPLADRVRELINLATETAMLCIAWLIAFRAGHSSANLAMALAISVISLNGTLASTLVSLGHEHDALAITVNTLTYVAGAALFIRASQLFPIAISADRIARSATLWGRWKFTRGVLTSLLKPAVLWPVIAALALLDDLSGVALVANISRLCIIGLGIVYFRINYRDGGAEVRHKVLWFLAWAVASAVVSLVMLAISAALGPDTSAVLRAVLRISLNALNSLLQLFCVAAAVFYAGALSPSLVIRKTMVFGLTTAVLLFVFASVEVFLHHLIVHFLEVTDTLASSLLGGAFGLAFHPVKHYFERLLGKFFGKNTESHA